MARGLWAIAFCLLGAPVFAQQAASTTRITGVVIDAKADTPIRRARVETGATSAPSAPVFTDESGQFSIDVPPGATLAVSKAGFAPTLTRLANARRTEPAEVRVALNRSATISGHLIDGSGTPLFNINVALREIADRRSGASPRTTSTNDLGEFRFGALPAGEFALAAPIATEPVRVDFGDIVDIGDVTYERSTASASSAARVAEPRRRPALTGTIYDEYGDPIQGATIRVLQVRRVGERLAALPPEGVQSRRSDDRGSYRIFGLPAGRYLVIADVEGYASTYYAGVTNVAYALPVTVDRADADGIDIAFRHEPTVRVSGTALDSAGQPAVGAALLGISQRSGAMMIEPKAARISTDGTFAFDSVPAGDYVVQVSTPFAGLQPKVEDGRFLVPRMEFGMRRLTVTDDEPAPVFLRTTPGATLRGRMITDGQVSAPRQLTVWPSPTDFDLSPMIGSGPTGLTKSDDGSFVVTGVTGPRRFQMMAPVDDWYLKEARVHGVDALDSPWDFGVDARDVDDIEIVVSPLGAAVSGAVTKPGGDPVANYVVLLFSTDPSKWYRASQSMRMVTSSQDRQFRIRSLPPGSYYLLAMSDAADLVTSGEWQDPAVLDRLRSRALQITLGEGERQTVALIGLP